MTAKLVVTRNEGLARLELNRPERLNAIDSGLLAELAAALAALSSESDLRVLVLTGRGRSFCAGDDLDEASSATPGADQARGFVDRLQAVTRHMLLGPFATVTLVRGWAVGGGFSWAIGADFPLWSAEARGLLPEAGYGLFASGGATWLLERSLGAPAARRLLLLGEPVPAERLAAGGLILPTIADAALEAEGEALCRRLLALPPASLARYRRAFAEGDRAALEAALAREASAMRAAIADPDVAARIAAERARVATAARSAR